MSMQIGAVIFDDASRLYLIYDGMQDTALRPLFPTVQAAREWLASGLRGQTEPDEASFFEEPVTLVPDVSLEKEIGLAGSFASQASRKSMWLTGPRSFLEMAYTNGATASRAF